MVSNNANIELKWEPLAHEETPLKMANNNTQHADPLWNATTHWFDIKEIFLFQHSSSIQKNIVSLREMLLLLKKGANQRSLRLKEQLVEPTHYDYIDIRSTKTLTRLSMLAIFFWRKKKILIKNWEEQWKSAPHALTFMSSSPMQVKKIPSIPTLLL